RSNNTYNITKWLTLTSNINITGRMANYMDGNVLFYVDQATPFDSPYDENGELKYFGSAGDIYGRYKNNPMLAFSSGGVKDNSKRFGLHYDFILDFKITPWMSFVTQNRINASTNKTHYHRIDNIETMEGGDLIEESQSLYYGGISTNMLKFSHDWKANSFSALVGYEAQMSHWEDIEGSGQGLPYGLYVLDVTSKNFTVGGSSSTSGMQSFIAQANYNYDKRYFFTGSFRVDQSSTFNAANRTAMFPSISAAWLISNEKWFTNKTVTNLKLKVSWGKTGMKDIGASRFLDSFGYSGQYDNNSAAIPVQMANPNLKWEQTSQFNAGIEIGVLDRLSIDLNYYRNVTNDLLVNRDLAPSVGFASQWQNLGSVLNTGFEAAVSATPVKVKDFRWDIDFSIAYNYNRLSGFGDTKIYKSTYEGIQQVYRDGGELYTWYLREYAGINPENGRQQFVKEDGTLTEDYNEARFIEAGSALTPWEGGISTYLTWKNFKLSATGNFVWGNYLYGRKRASSLTTFVSNSFYPSNEDSIWRQPGDIATIGLPSASSATLYHTGYLVRGDYFKLRNISLSYTLPKNVIGGCGLTFTLSCDNVFTLTTVWGADPEVGRDGSIPGRIYDLDGRYPNKRVYSLALNFSF
ncbi:MAG: TonB-dependent receptor domain-containing protein, partial [Candidatus Cryptobacteroides sp.]